MTRHNYACRISISAILVHLGEHIVVGAVHIIQGDIRLLHQLTLFIQYSISNGHDFVFCDDLIRHFSQPLSVNNNYLPNSQGRCLELSKIVSGHPWRNEILHPRFAFPVRKIALTPCGKNSLSHNDRFHHRHRE